MPATISFTARDATSSEYSPMFTTLQEDKFYIEKKLQQKIKPPPHTHTHTNLCYNVSIFLVILKPSFHLSKGTF